jgi:hypothetical protein
MSTLTSLTPSTDDDKALQKSLETGIDKLPSLDFSGKRSTAGSSCTI